MQTRYFLYTDFEKKEFFSKPYTLYLLATNLVLQIYRFGTERKTENLFFKHYSFNLTITVISHTGPRFREKNGGFSPNLTLNVLQTRLLQTHRFSTEKKTEHFSKPYIFYLTVTTITDTQVPKEKKTDDFI